jgi:hypothetical protein
VWPQVRAVRVQSQAIATGGRPQARATREGATQAMRVQPQGPVGEDGEGTSPGDGDGDGWKTPGDESAAPEGPALGEGREGAGAGDEDGGGDGLAAPVENNEL